MKNLAPLTEKDLPEYREMGELIEDNDSIEMKKWRRQCRLKWQELNY